MAPLYLGSTAISKVYKGSTELAQNYLGDSTMLSNFNEENFGIVTYTGASSTNSITGVGFQPDLVWIKDRGNDEQHILNDSTRGATKDLSADRSNTEATRTTGFLSFDSDGFTLGTDGGGVVNDSTRGPYVAWCWKANGGTTYSSTSGSITSTVQANPAAGFSIVTYAGNNGASATIGHGLSSAPQLIFVKGRNVTAGWPTAFNDGSYSNYGIRLNQSTVDLNNQTVFFNNTAPTSTVFSVGSADEVNDGYNYVAYCFHSVAGYQKVGSYTGTGSIGLTVSLGFQARFIMVKKVAPSGDRWLMADTSRHAATNNDAFLDTTSTLSERDFNCTNGITFTSNGFTINTTDGSFNSSGGTYIYLAIA